MLLLYLSCLGYILEYQTMNVKIERSILPRDREAQFWTGGDIKRESSPAEHP